MTSDLYICRNIHFCYHDPMYSHPACTICKSHQLIPIKRYTATPEVDNGWRERLIKNGSVSIRLVMCFRCGFLFYRDVPDYQEMSHLYANEGRYEYLHDAVTDDTGRLKELQRGIDLLLKTGNFKKESKIIDVGAGDFLVTDKLLEEHPDCDYSALDPSYRQKSYKSVHVHRSMIEEFEPTEQYDLVILIHVLEHISDINLFMSKLSALIKPGGQFYIEIPFLVGPGLFLNRSVNTLSLIHI
jgi:hypothetical protein